MNLIDLSCNLKYRVHTPTIFMFNISVMNTTYQTIDSEKFMITPEARVTFMDVGEKGNRIMRLQMQPGDFTLAYKARVKLYPQIHNPSEIEEEIFEKIPVEVLPYLNPSRYCESDRLARLAMREFGQQTPGHQRVQSICDWTQAQLQYVSGSTDARSSACDVLVQGAGVCRDFAHLAITLCRALCIPARYVSGYAVGLKPQDFHGFFEAYLKGGWYLFDATRMAPRNGLVRIGAGRDASDVSFATIIGEAVLLDMQVLATEVTNNIDQDMATEQAVSTV